LVLFFSSEFSSSFLYHIWLFFAFLLVILNFSFTCRFHQLAIPAHHGVQENPPMKSARSRLCLCCNDLFDADVYNAHRQKYCTKPTCRKASKVASQNAWIAKPENVNYHSGAIAVARVRNWQKAHPEYRERQRVGRGVVLQDSVTSQPDESTAESIILPDISPMLAPPAPPALQDIARPEPHALQDFAMTQHHVFIGLISHFFDITLQEDLDSTTRSLQKLGEDIANGRKSDELFKAGNLYRTRAAGAGAVQLGGSAVGSG
jgi:hypothetical protein